MASDETTLRLYNTLTRTKEDFVPLDPGNVRMYVCGPTVYDYAHIGNARPAIVFDVLYRLLSHLYPGQGAAPNGSRVTYVRNITDVDDKIIERARRDYPGDDLNAAIRKLTETTNAQYQKDMTALGCLPPTAQPRATDHIDEMVDMIATLIEKKNAYEAEGHVLFDVKSWKSGNALAYGKLSNRSLDDMIAGARVEVAPYKRDPMDFVLWKPSKEDEPGWESPWGKGRPGWHIECSAMSAELLGDTFDIHGGGIDLVFPHHENEIAQSRCAHDGAPMAQVWMHNGYLQLESAKMSKSTGNFVTVDELLETQEFGGRKWPGDVLRLAMLMTHYRDPIDFSVGRLEEAEAILVRWKRRILELGLDFTRLADQTPEDVGTCSKLVAALSDDLNTSGAVAELHRHAAADTEHNRKRLWGSLLFLGVMSPDAMAEFARAEANRAADAGVDEADVTGHIDARLAALAAKDFAEADRIRDELAAQGIQLMDYKDAKSGERRTKWEVKR